MRYLPLLLLITACSGETPPAASSSSSSSGSSTGGGSSGSTGSGCTSRWYPDVDGDGYGDVRSEGVRACSGPAGMVSDHTDCDDSSNWVHPGADYDARPASTQSTRQLFDLNCDGRVEEDQPRFSLGSSRSCFMSGTTCVNSAGGLFVFDHPRACGESVQAYFCQSTRSDCYASPYGHTMETKRCR